MAIATGWKRSIVKHFFDRFAKWQLDALMAPATVIELEYALEPTPRYGFGKPPHAGLSALIAANDDAYEARLRSMLKFSDAISAIARDQVTDGTGPTFQNTYFTGLDAIAYYGIVATEKPRTIFEIGSGFSTRFARRAIRDHGLSSRIVTCDPEPRTDIDSISDETIRAPFEKLDMSRLDVLGENDILFIDGSHRTFTNSDVTVQFLEALPRLKPGVFVHIHDILLPYDYPPAWSKRFYSEQYLLASYLLGGSARMEIACPNAYLSKSDRFAPLIGQMFQSPGMEEVKRFSLDHHHGFLGFSFWLRVVA